MDIKENALDAIGNTPLVRLARIKERFGLKADIYAKLERANPTGSVKDRIAKEMILSALKDGRIEKGTVIVEPTRADQRQYRNRPCHGLCDSWLKGRHLHAGELFP